MNDLISRSKVISVLEQLEEHSLTGKMDISNVIYLLNNTPTAYDVDDVIKELEKIRGLVCHGKSCSECKYTTYCFEGEQSENVAIDKAIEIVKQGVIANDVCEYETKDDVIYTSCNNKSIASAFCWFNECGDYKYCPYCGKKIKVVE